MTDDSGEQTTPKTRQFMSSTVSTQPTIPEEPSDVSAIARLVVSTPLVDPEKASIPVPPPDASHRSRRRSSFSVLQSLLNINHSIPNKDIRKRNLLVGSGRQISANSANDISVCFPHGRALTIMVVTWNTAEAAKLYKQNYTPSDRDDAEGKESMLEDIADILLPDCIEHISDMIIVCTQEMTVNKNDADWEVLLQEVIGPTHVLFSSAHFGTLSLCIFLRRDLIWFCTQPEQDVVKFRAVNPVRTKASLALTFNLFGTSFMIINSHFESGEDTSDQSVRCTNFQNTMTQIAIPSEFVKRMATTTNDISALANLESMKSKTSTASVDKLQRSAADKTKSCDCVFWAGDMNFRVYLPRADVLAAIEQGNYQKILLGDEFSSMRTKTGHPYADFKEESIQFPPTYKIDTSSGSDSYAKHRVPSYTDRILYRDKPSSPIVCTVYQSVESIKHSDHKPLIAQFQIKLKPGLAAANQSYGKFNQEVYSRGCQQRERHLTMGVGLHKNRALSTSVCVIL